MSLSPAKISLWKEERINFMPAYPLVTIVIPTLNSKENLLRCLRSLTASSYKNVEIIVVDNSSTDGTAEAVRQYYPEVKLITLNKNMGVTGGRNAGAKVAKGDFILFLDHDMMVDERMIETLIEIMQKESSIGALGPVIYYFDKAERIWAAGTSINMLTGKINFNCKITDKTYFEVQVLPAAIMVKKEVVQKIGLFDEIFFATYEDTDFCFRIRKAGYRVACTPQAKAWHITPSDRRSQELHLLSRSYYIARNRIIFMKKHAKLLNFLIFLIFFVPVYAMYYTWQCLRRWRLSFIKEYWRGLIDGLGKAL